MKHVDIKEIKFQAEGIAIANALRLQHVYLVGLASSECSRRVTSKRQNKKKNGLAVPVCSLRPGSAHFL